MVMAIQSIKAEGLKTAALTNNWIIVDRQAMFSPTAELLLERRGALLALVPPEGEGRRRVATAVLGDQRELVRVGRLELGQLTVAHRRWPLVHDAPRPVAVEEVVGVGQPLDVMPARGGER